MSEPDGAPRSPRPRRPLFQKYFLVLFTAVVVPLLANGGSEAWFGYRDQQVSLGQRLHVEATSAAGKIRGFLDDITDQLQWTVQLPWTSGSEDQHRLDVLRLMRQVPAIVEIKLIDGGNIERLHVSRIDHDVINSGIDRSADPAVVGARAERVWYGPVTFYQGSEPHMQIAVAGARNANGLTV